MGNIHAEGDEMRGRLICALSAVAVLMLSGCFKTANANNDQPIAAASGLTLKILEPRSGAAVTTPFLLKVESNVPLGRVATGEHHIHIWFDDNSSDYSMIQGDSDMIVSAPPGHHVMHVSLVEPNHKPTGVQTSVTLDITLGVQPSPSDDDGSY
jgi:hypothetical protein